MKNPYTALTMQSDRGLRRFTRALPAAVALGLTLGSAPATLADVTSTNQGVRAIAMPGDTRLVQFRYDPNNTYTILTRPMSVTNIQLRDDEELVALALGDTIQWVVTDSERHVFIKPLASGLVTTATMVTTQRTYQMTLRSSPEDGMFYQQVTWHNPAVVALERQRNQILTRAHQIESRAIERERNVDREEGRVRGAVAASGVQLEDLNFDYDVKGSAQFAPTQVFDDGRFTWLRMPDHQELPAVFMINDSGDAELLNFTVQDRYIVIQRRVPGVLLKLGAQEVRVTPKGRGGFFSRSSRTTSHQDDFWGDGR